MFKIHKIKRQHLFNPLHVYCCLSKLGLDRKRALVAARIYEKVVWARAELITRVKKFNL